MNSNHSVTFPWGSGDRDTEWAGLRIGTPQTLTGQRFAEVEVAMPTVTNETGSNAAPPGLGRRLSYRFPTVVQVTANHDPGSWWCQHRLSEAELSLSQGLTPLTEILAFLKPLRLPFLSIQQKAKLLMLAKYCARIRFSWCRPCLIRCVTKDKMRQWMKLGPSSGQVGKVQVIYNDRF